MTTYLITANGNGEKKDTSPLKTVGLEKGGYLKMKDKCDKLFRSLLPVLVCLLMVYSVSSSAEIKYMTAQESAARKDRCAQNPKCLKSVNQRKEKMGQRRARFTRWCGENSEACAERKAQMKRQMANISDKCKKNTAQCEKLVEQRLSMSRKEARKNHCSKNPQKCADRKALRAKRKAKRQAWCEANPERCVGRESKRKKTRRAAIARTQPNQVK